jgi:PAS domain-containing protein
MNAKLFSGRKYLRSILDAIPSPVLIVNRNLEIRDANRAAVNLIKKDSRVLLKRLCGELLNCVHVRRSGGCGKTPHCKNCVLRQTAENLKSGQTVVRRITEMQLQTDDKVTKVWYLVSGALLENEAEDLVVMTLEDVTEVVELRKILPICSHCRKVRNDEHYWQEVEEFLEKSAGIDFSHSICPECASKHYAEFTEDSD